MKIANTAKNAERIYTLQVCSVVGCSFPARASNKPQTIVTDIADNARLTTVNSLSRNSFRVFIVLKFIG